MSGANLFQRPEPRDIRGVTLMEILVVLAVFSITILIAVDIFFAITRLQRHADAQQRVQSDARFVIESMVRDVHSGTFDYELYDALGYDLEGSVGPPIVPPDLPDKLLLYDPEGNQRRYWYDDTVQKIKFCQCTISGSCPNPGALLTPGCPNAAGETTWQNITPDSIDITSAVFLVGPPKDPFDLSNGTHVQPHATIAIGSTSDDLKGENVFLQSTVTSRAYKR